jgi:hypothetical protein
MENSFSSLINASNSILILLPTKPYFDQVAAGLGLYLSLKSAKNVTISCPSPMTVDFSRLVGVDKISQEFGSKNLTIRLADYDANQIERVSYDIENGEFKLTVIPKSGQESPKKEQVNVSFSGVAGDTTILIGGLNETHFPALLSNKLEGAKIMHVGNKSLSSSQDRGIMSFARPTSSNSELVADLITEGGLTMDADIATNLLSGIEDGSREFSGSDVTAETFQMMANLMKAGGIRISKEKLVRKNFPPGIVPGEEIHPDPVQPRAPKDWMEPKIYKGNTQS